jgi:threonine 3-dehydrogenase
MTSLRAPEAESAHAGSTMRAVVKAKPERGVEFVTAYAEPQVSAGKVKIQIAAASVCGTDRALYDYSPMAQAFNLKIPVVLGHECAGTVTEVGSGVESLKVGDKVALESHVACWDCYPCRTGDAHNCLNMELLGLHLDGGFAERLVVPAGACFRLPIDFPLEQGALLEPAGVAMHAIQRSKIDLSGADVVISGGGPVGLFIAAIAGAMGAANVVVVEPNAYRRGLIEAPGATALTPKTMSSGRVGGFRATRLVLMSPSKRQEYRPRCRRSLKPSAGKRRWSPWGFQEGRLNWTSPRT